MRTRDMMEKVTMGAPCVIEERSAKGSFELSVICVICVAS